MILARSMVAHYTTQWVARSAILAVLMPFGAVTSPDTHRSGQWPNRISSQTSAILVSNPDTLSLAFASTRVLITSAHLASTDFADTVLIDSAKIVELGFGSLEGAQLQVIVAPGQSIRTTARFGFGFVQYLTDEDPAPSLEFRYQSNWVVIPTHGSTLRLPTFLNPEEGAPDLSKLLGYVDREALEVAIGRRFFFPLKRESLALQSLFWRGLLRDSTYASCCPEYITQARQFLAKASSDFETTADLDLELYHRDTLLRLQILSGGRVSATLVLLIVPEQL